MREWDTEAILYIKYRQAWREGGQPGHWPGAHGQRGPIFNEQKNVLWRTINSVQIMSNDKFGWIIINNWSFIITLHWVPNGFITIMGACYHFITAMVAIYRYGFITAMGTIYGFFTAIGAHTFFFWSWPRNFSRRPWWEVGRGRKNNKSCSRQ